MSNQRPLILVTNDDGIKAKGLLHLARCVRDMADVILVAPDEPQSGKSSAITVDAPLRITEHPDYEGVRAFSVSGTPVDCVKLALHSILPRRPDLLLSGINHGSNSGNSIIYSGTMGAVIEGCTNGIPSIGFSLLHHSPKADFSFSTRFVIDIINRAISFPIPKGCAFNVNMPAHMTPRGVRVCRAARGHWNQEYKRYLDPMGNPFFFLSGNFVNEEPDATDTDEYWLSQKYISLVPVSADQTLSPIIPSLKPLYNIS